MTAAALDDEGFEPLGSFELDAPADPGDGTPMEALRLLGVATRSTSAGARAVAWARLAEIWAAAGSAGLERDARARAESPSTDSLRRLLTLFVESGRWSDAARTAEAIAAVDPTPEARAEAWRRWVSAGSLDDARRLAHEGDGAQIAMAYLARSTESEAVLAAAAEAAQGVGDVDAWRARSLDAWIESQGARGGGRLIDALLAASRARAALLVTLDEAARVFLDEGADLAALVAPLQRATELVGDGPEALAVWTLRALLPGPEAAPARETLRDLLADRGRTSELAVRLRVDAWSAPEASRAAAWKGVAAMELPNDPLLATRALVEGLRAQPDDAEALALLRTLAAEPSVEAATRDAVWGLVRASEISDARRGELLLWLGSLEEAAGDLAAAESAYASVQDAMPAAYEGLARVLEGAARQVAQAEAAFGALGHGAEGPLGEALDAAVARCAATPGALAAAGAALETLATAALDHADAAALWVRSARRSAEAGTLVAVLRRLATRASIASVRRDALLEALTLPEFSAGGGSDAVELLRLYLEDLPGDATIAAALAALAEQRGEGALVREAVRALATASVEPAERDTLQRFVGARAGVFAVLGAATEEPTPSPERGNRLRQLHELVGESVTLLALRTRALMAAPGAAGEALGVARRFVEVAPWSPEAVFAFAGLARLGDDAGDVAAGIVAALRSCARLPELGSLVRGAVARLVELGDLSAVHRVLDEATDAGLLADRAVADLALTRTHGDGAVTVRRLELAIAGADAPDPAWIERLVGLRSEMGGAVGALGARLRRGDADDAREAELDALADEAADDEAQGRWVRCAVASGHAQAALRWLSRWAAARGDGAGAGLRLRCAARVAWAERGDGEAALEFLRDALRADADVAEVLRDADTIGRRPEHLDELLSVYDDAAAVAAGDHGRRALHYRRALAQERAARLDDALDAQLALFRETRTIGAPLRAVERLAERTGRWGAMLEALEILSAEAPSSEAKVQFLLRCAEVTRAKLRAPERALRYELEAWQASRSRALWERVIDRARALRPSHPEVAAEAVSALIDGELAAGQQAWDDSVRGLHALQALDCALNEAHDADRAVAAVGLYLRQHESPATARATVLEMIDRPSVPAALRATVRASAALGSGPPAEAPVTRPPSRMGTLELVLDEDDDVDAPVAPVLGAIEGAPEDAPVRPSRVGGEWISFVAEPRPVVPASTRAAASIPPLLTQMPPVVELGVEDLEPELDPQTFLITSIAPVKSPRGTPDASAPPPEAAAAHSDEVLREAAARGDDAATVILAKRLAADPARSFEAAALQRARFDADPTRVDALDALIELAKRGERRGEVLGLTQARAVLRGEPVDLHPLHPVELEDPPEGVARVLLPSRVGPFAELGALLWDSVGVTWRRELQRSAARDAGVRIPPSSSIQRPFQAALRLLQLPRTVVLALREGPIGAPTIVAATQPVAVVMSLEQATDTPVGHFALGHHLEGARTGHLPMTALAPEAADRMVRALAFAFGAPGPERIDPAVAAAAAELMDVTPTRLHRQVRAYVEELGPALTPARWRAVIDQARARAGLLVCGDFFEAARWLLASAPAEVPRSLSWAFAEWEPLRELLRFAVSEEYLLLRWPNSDGRRRRNSSRPAPR